MKKIALIACLLMPFAPSAFAANAAGASPIAPSGTPVAHDITNTDCAMVSSANTFAITPSANVGMAYVCDSAAAAIQTGSTKGKYVYGGGTSGGSVKQCGGSSPVAVSTTNGYAAAPTITTGDGCS